MLLWELHPRGFCLPTLPHIRDAKGWHHFLNPQHFSSLPSSWTAGSLLLLGWYQQPLLASKLQDGLLKLPPSLGSSRLLEAGVSILFSYRSLSSQDKVHFDLAFMEFSCHVWPHHLLYGSPTVCLLDALVS